MKHFYMCLVDGTSGCKVRHPNLLQALKEVERLTRKELKGVSVLGVIGYCKPSQIPVEWQFPNETSQ